MDQQKKTPERPPEVVDLEFKLTRVEATFLVQGYSRVPQLAVRAVLVAAERARMGPLGPTTGPEVLSLLITASESVSSWLMALFGISATESSALRMGLPRWRKIAQVAAVDPVDQLAAIEKAYAAYEQVVSYTPALHVGSFEVPLPVSLENERPTIDVGPLERQQDGLAQAGAIPAIGAVLDAGTILDFVGAFRLLIDKIIERLPGTDPGVLEMRQIVRQARVRSLAETAEEITSLPEWQAYAAAPSSATLGALFQRAGIGAPGPLVSTLLARVNEQPNWKVMQHLGLVLDRLGHAVYARVCAHEAFRMSSGDPRAALSLALALWRSRLPGLLVFYADIARRRLHNLRPRSERPRIRKELVGLRARAAFYHGHQADARRWGAALWREGADRETAEQVLLGAARLGETGSELRAVDVLRPHGLSLTPSIRQLVEGVIVRERQNLLVVLAARTRYV